MQQISFDASKTNKQIEADLNKIGSNIIKKVENNNKSLGNTINQLSNSTNMRG
jgi:hypothetical protein